VVGGKEGLLPYWVILSVPFLQQNKQTKNLRSRRGQEAGKTRANFLDITPLFKAASELKHHL
jgi:hypothetical protein